MSFHRGLRPPPPLTVAEWSDRHRILAGKASSEPGAWRTSRTPYLRAPMDCMGPHSATEMVVLLYGAQTGKTEASLCALGYLIDIDPGPILYVSPTVESMKRVSRQRIAPLISETPALRGLVAESRSRDESNTVLLKEFDGGALVMTGANSAVGLRSMPARVIFCDELDAFPPDVDGEGAPLELALKRQSTFPNRKTWVASTPTTKGASRIEQLYESSNQYRFYVPCPHCDTPQALRWSQLKWDEGSPETARYACESCGTLIDERHKTAMLAAGEWRAEHPERGERIAGFYLNSLYSPLGWVSWADLAREFMAASHASKKGDVSLLRVFVNTRLAETFEEGTRPSSTHALAERADDYPLANPPAGVLILTAGADVQGDRIECYTWGWGRDDESWLVDYRSFFGSPSERGVWSDLATYLRQPIARESGGELKIISAGIDTGGHHTQMAYSFCLQHRRWFALKGSSLTAQPVIGRPSAIEGKAGVRVYPVGTDTAKGLLYGRLAVEKPGPGYVHVPEAILHEVPDFYEQLTAERLVTKYKAGHPVMRWAKQSGARNEAIDCLVYALAAFHGIGGHRIKPVAWAQAQAMQNKADPTTEPQPRTEEPVVRPPRQNWVTSFRRLY
jgi:phage terminase large subunit GpA-like protein